MFEPTLHFTRPLNLVPNWNFVWSVNDMQYETTCYVRELFLGPMFGLKIEYHCTVKDKSPCELNYVSWSWSHFINKFLKREKKKNLYCHLSCCSTAEITVKLRNTGQDAFKPNTYGESIIVERKLTKEGTSSYKLKNSQGKTCWCENNNPRAYGNDRRTFLLKGIKWHEAGVAPSSKQ